jgi:hypothetical protein
VSDRERLLAGRIASCPAVQAALENKEHSCHKVVHEQTKIISLEKFRQRPEPWMGGVESAKLLFVSSNPSINEDPFPLGEVFPTNEWSEQESADFFVDRCNPDKDPVSVSFSKNGEPNFLTLCHDGEYRSGVSNPKRPQPTWKNTHDRAKELIGETAHPHFDYAITEIVHCKSKDARGVEEASRFCTDKWMESIFNISPATVVILLGSKVRDFYAIPVLGAASSFGQWAGYDNLTQEERALRDIFVENIGGKDRIFVFNWHPTFAGLRVYEKVYGERLVNWLTSVIAGKTIVPTKKNLRLTIKGLFASS